MMHVEFCFVTDTILLAGDGFLHRRLVIIMYYPDIVCQIYLFISFHAYLWDILQVTQTSIFMCYGDLISLASKLPQIIMSPSPNKMKNKWCTVVKNHPNGSQEISSSSSFSWFSPVISINKANLKWGETKLLAFIQRHVAVGHLHDMFHMKTMYTTPTPRIIARGVW